MIMTNDAPDQAPNRSKLRKLAVSMMVGAAVGFLGAMAVLHFADRGVLAEAGRSVEIALLVAMLYGATGLMIAAGTLSPAMGAKFLNVEDADELREQRRMLGYSAGSMIALGLALAMVALAAPAGPVSPLASLAGALALFALAVILALRQARHLDELMHAVGREAGANAFYLAVLVGGGWAMLAHLGYAVAPRALDWLTLFAVVMLLGAFWACGRRGLLTPR